MHNLTDTITPLREFVVAMTALVTDAPPEAELLARARPLLARLIADGRWLPAEYAEPDPSGYRQYLLHCDPLERFSVVSFVWGPGQLTPVHDHTVWGLIGLLRGAEICREYMADATGRIVPTGVEHRLEPGAIDAVSPSIGDWHVVSNALLDRPSVSIHVYGANIGTVRRHRLDDAGEVHKFISGYSSARTPSLSNR